MQYRFLQIDKLRQWLVISKFASYKLRYSVLSRDYKLGETIRRNFERVRNFNAFQVTASTVSLYPAVEFHAEIIYEPRALSVTLSFTSFQRALQSYTGLYCRLRDSQDLPVCIKPLCTLKTLEVRVRQCAILCSCCAG